MSTLLRESEVAQMINLSIHWLRRKRWSGGGIPYIKMDGAAGAVRYRSEDVEAFMASRSRKSTSDQGKAA
jgi:Helix-turn-helix domain